MPRDDAQQGSHFLGTVLVTGGTGTFGHAFTERVLRDNLAERVKILSRDEKKQADMQAQFDDPRLRFFLGDVRDQARLERAFQGVDVVIHAAALKRVERSASDIMEFVLTNVYGTMNVINACHNQGVRKLIALSSDKAVSSVTPYGATKALMEWYAIAGNVYGSTRSACVRYGNIVGSRGSVLETWRRQYEAGRPLTVTDERMTRFWISIEDAVALVLLAVQRSGGGEIFIPKNVARGSILDLARRYFPDAGFRVTGSRAYEKLHESLVSPDEVERLRDAGDVYVLVPHPNTVRWAPGPYGVDFPPVPVSFQYRSDI